MAEKPTIANLRRKFIDGSYTPNDALAAALSVVKAEDGEVHAFHETFTDAAEAAQAATEQFRTEGNEAPPLCGIPVAMKSNILIKDKHATASAKILESYRATYDATVTARLRQSGAIFIGSTNMDEFAMGSSTENSAFGPTRNPLDKTRVTGGSSGGSAAAVAMGATPAALGTDTGGSIRQPASFCGLVGYKPTYGTVSRYGLIAMGSSLDQAGPLAHTVSDAELIHNVIAGFDPLDATTIPSGAYPEAVTKKDIYRIGIPWSFLREGLDDDVADAFSEQVKRLTAVGHEIVELALPLFERGLAAYYIVMPAEVSSNLARFDGVRYGHHLSGSDLLADYCQSRATGFGAEVKRRIILGTYVLSAGYYDAYYGRAEHVRVLMRRELKDAFKACDLIMTPTSPSPAFKIGEKSDPLSMYKQDIFTVPVNLTGVPAISIPSLSVTRNHIKLPVGVQYIAPSHGDARLFDFGKKVNQE